MASAKLGRRLEREVRQHMRKNGKPIVDFVIHVPKCAGTTIERHLQNHLGNGFFYAPRWRSPLRDFIGNRYPHLEPAALRKVRVVSGHSLSTGLRRKFESAVIRESLILRDPISWHVSMYCYRARLHGWIPDARHFERWYQTVRRNPVSRFLLNRYFEQGVPALYRLSSRARLAFLEARLAGFYFVGGLEQTNELIAGLSHELGIPEAAERENTRRSGQFSVRDLDPNMLDRILHDNMLDQALYDRWSGRGWSQPVLPAAPLLPTRDHAAALIGDVRTALLRKIATA